MSSSRNLVFIGVVAITGGACTGDFATEGAQQVGSPDARPAAEAADAADVDVQPDPCLGVIAAGHRAISCDGMVFDVEVPGICVQGGCGVIVDVHGGTMSAQMEDANTNMRALGREHGFIVIQPNANVEPPLASFSVEDDLRVLGLVERMLATWPVDSRRVHLTGFSQGGYMG